MTGQALMTGTLTGLAYAVMAAGVVLVYRVSRVVNVAHVELGALAATLVAKLVIDYRWNWVVACVVVCAAAAVAGAAIELTVIRRLSAQPRLVSLVATIGLSGVLLAARLAVTFDRPAGVFPLPFERHLEVGGITIYSAGLLAMVMLPAVLVGLGLFMSRTPDGVVMRSVAGNPDAARLAGIPVERVSTAAWAIAGLLAAIGVIGSAGLLNLSPAVPHVASGPSMLLAVLAAALVGRMRSISLTVVCGIAIGVVEAALLQHFDRGTRDAVMVVIIAVAGLAFARRDSLARGARGEVLPPEMGRGVLVAGADPSADTGGVAGPAPAAWHRWRRRWSALGVLVAAVAAPMIVATPSTQQSFSRILLASIVVVSVTVLAGWGGQLSLGQYGFVGCGAAVTAALVERGLPLAAAALYAVVAGVVLAAGVGLLAARGGGLYVAVVTLGFAVAVPSFAVPRLLGQRTATVPRASLGPVDLADQRTYYYLCLAALTVTLVAMGRLRRSGAGRAIAAVRDHERAAAAFGLSPTVAKITVFTVSGAIATAAGTLFAGLDVYVTADGFRADDSLRAVATAVIGGLGSLAGAVAGAVWAVGVPAFAGDSATARLLTTAPFLLVLLLYFPRGFAGIPAQVSTTLGLGHRGGTRRGGHAVAAGHGSRIADGSVGGDDGGGPDGRGGPDGGGGADGGDGADDADRLRARLRGQRSAAPALQPGSGDASAAASGGHAAPALRTVRLTVKFGGVVAVDRVSIDVGAGEMVGLIGANGAGKSTLLDAVSGFVPARGEVALFGRRADRWAPSRRARVGLGRTFQHAGLFGNLTVEETLLIALERSAPSQVVAAMLALPTERHAERAKRDAAAVHLAEFGLDEYGGTPISQLSTGTRRVVELACLVARGDRMIVLDEPTAGIAHGEVEAFGEIVRDVRASTNAAMLIVEHDLTVVSSLCDRVYCMDRGRVVAEDQPGELVTPR